MVRRADEHDVEVLLLEHLAIVPVSARLLLRLLPLARNLHGFGEHVFIRIADGNDLDGCDLNQSPQVTLAIPAGADQADAPGLAVDEVERASAERRERSQRGESGCR